MPRGKATRYGSREWEWDPSHFPRPLTPAFASVYTGWTERAFAVMFAEFGVIAERLEARTRRGYLYTRPKPVGFDRPPPAWLTAIGLRLWWLHPAVRRRVRRAVERVRADYSTAVLRRWETEWRPAILTEQERLRAVPLAALDDAALAAHLSHLVARTGEWVTVHFLLHGAIALPLVRLEDFLAERPGPGGLRVTDLLRGTSRASSAPARELEAVAAPLREDPALLSRAAALQPAAALRLLQEGSPAFATALARYLERHGQGIVGRYEFAVPTLAEQPEAIVPALLHAARSPSGVEREAARATARRIEEAAARLRDPEVERRFRSLVFAAQRAYAVRDDNTRITYTNAFGLIRLALLQAGGRFARRGWLAGRDDVFFLTVPETIAVLRGAPPVPRARVQARQQRWRDADRTPPPRALGRRRPPVDLSGLPAEAREVSESVIRYMTGMVATLDSSEQPAATAADVRGLGAVGGRYTGVARVLHGEADFDRLAPGEVLVCAMTSPAWAAVLPLAGALVTDHGGVLSHAAVIAREFGIPAVVATGCATTTLPDGALVEVDGDAGRVRVLDPSTTDPR